MNIKKGIRIFMITLAAVCTFCIMNVFAAEEIQVYVNNNLIEFDVPPQAINNRTMIPFRYVANTFGADVDYEIKADGTTVVSAVLDNKTLLLTIGDTNATLIENGAEQILEFDVAPVIVDNRTLVPVRLIGEAFGCCVGWNGDENHVIIIDPSDLADYINKLSPDIYNNVLNIDFSNLTGAYEGNFSFKFPDPYTFELIESQVPFVILADGNAVKITVGLPGDQNYSSAIITDDCVYESVYSTEADLKWRKTYDESALSALDAKDIIKALIDASMEQNTPTSRLYSELRTIIDNFIKSNEENDGFKITSNNGKEEIACEAVLISDAASEIKLILNKELSDGKTTCFELTVKGNTKAANTTSEIINISFSFSNTEKDYEIILPEKDYIIK